MLTDIAPMSSMVVLSGWNDVLLSGVVVLPGVLEVSLSSSCVMTQAGQEVELSVVPIDVPRVLSNDAG